MLKKSFVELQKNYDELFISNKLNELISKVDKLTKSLPKNDVENYDHDAEERFMEMEVEIQDIIGESDQKREIKIKAFVATMVRTVMSVGFKQF